MKASTIELARAHGFRNIDDELKLSICSFRAAVEAEFIKEMGEPVAWTDASWLSQENGGHFWKKQLSKQRDIPLYKLPEAE
jgi:hypothetical protein